MNMTKEEAINMLKGRFYSPYEMKQVQRFINKLEGREPKQCFKLFKNYWCEGDGTWHPTRCEKCKCFNSFNAEHRRERKPTTETRL